MHAGGAPLGAFVQLPDPGPHSPVPILADWIDPLDGELRLNRSRTPVDGAVIEGFRVQRRSGLAVEGVGQSMFEVRHTDDSSLAELPERARDAVREMEKLGLVRIKTRVEVMPGRGDHVGVRCEVLDLTTSPEELKEFVVQAGGD